MKKIIIKNIITSIVSLFIGISTLIVTCLFVFQKLEPGVPASASAAGIYFFRYYTSDSNFLVAIVSFIISGFCIKNILQKRDEMPLWLIILFLISSTGTTVTFLTTAVFLAPTYAMDGYSYFAMFEGRLFFLHFLTPVLAIAMLIFLLDYYLLNWKHALMCILTVAIYSCFYVPFVLSGYWPDFYGFTFGGQLWVTPISLIVMYGVAIGIGFMLVLCHNLFLQKMHKKA